MDKQLSKQIYRYVAIDINDNISIPTRNKSELFDYMTHYISDESEYIHGNITRIMHYGIYKISCEFDYVICPCMSSSIKQAGTLIETRDVTVKLLGRGCTVKRHEWVKTSQSDGITDYTCKYCKRIKSMIFFDPCPLCHKEIQPLMCIID